MECLHQLRHTSPAKRPPCSIFETLPTGNFPFYGFWILGTRGYSEGEEKYSLRTLKYNLCSSAQRPTSQPSGTSFYVIQTETLAWKMPVSLETESMMHLRI